MTHKAVRLLHRTRGCGEVTEEDAAQRAELILTGWVHRRRDLGQLIFVEMRDYIFPEELESLPHGFGYGRPIVAFAAHQGDSRATFLTHCSYSSLSTQGRIVLRRSAPLRRPARAP